MTGTCLRPLARAAVRTTGAYFSRLAPCCSLWVPKSRVCALRYRNAGLSRKYAGPIKVVGNTHTTDADSSGSFLRRTRHTLNASKSVRNWTPNRGEVDRYVSPAASPSRRSEQGRVFFLTRTLLLFVDCEKYGSAGLTRKYAGLLTIVAHTHTLPTLLVPVRFYEELVKR